MSNHRHPVMDSSASSSRASMASIAHLPRLTETGEINRALPKLPLRVPQKSPRRNLPPGGGGIAGGPVPCVPSGDSSASHLSEPPTPTSPPLSPFKLTASEGSTSELHSPRGSVMQQKMADAEPEDDKGWIGHRQRRCRFMIVVGVFTAVVAGLTIGLAVGLSKGNAQPSSQSSLDSADSAVFPAGAYSFDTYLRANSTACTSRASSWQCYPETSTSSSRATFYWTVQDAGGGTHRYYVTGAGEPFGPAFANLPATMLDAGQLSERLTFAFAANKTVVTPAGGDGRVANCTYPGTVFQATLWTRRRAGQIVNAPSHPARYAPWPGEMEVLQYKNSTIGDPVCVDKQGKGVADVQAAGGSCLCRYTSTSMS